MESLRCTHLWGFNLPEGRCRGVIILRVPTKEDSLRPGSHICGVCLSVRVCLGGCAGVEQTPFSFSARKIGVADCVFSNAYQGRLMAATSKLAEPADLAEPAELAEPAS